MRCPHCHETIESTHDEREPITYFVAVSNCSVTDSLTYIKIGTTVNLPKRIRDLRFALSVPLEFLGSTTEVSERALHRRWQHLRMSWTEATSPDWIKRPRAAGPREWFRATPELVDEIHRLCQ